VRNNHSDGFCQLDCAIPTPPLRRGLKGFAGLPWQIKQTMQRLHRARQMRPLRKLRHPANEHLVFHTKSLLSIRAVSEPERYTLCRVFNVKRLRPLLQSLRHPAGLIGKLVFVRIRRPDIGSTIYPAADFYQYLSNAGLAH